MKTNQELEKNVQSQIKWDPLLNEIEIGIRAKDAVIQLTNLLNSYSKKSEAEATAKSQDALLKTNVEEALSLNWSINIQDITVFVSGTKVTLSGTVRSEYQKNEADRIAWNIPGVWPVTNEIKVEYDYALFD
jgi:osmotically-inducible protein OsmY